MNQPWHSLCHCPAKAVNSLARRIIANCMFVLPLVLSCLVRQPMVIAFIYIPLINKIIPCEIQLSTEDCSLLDGMGIIGITIDSKVNKVFDRKTAHPIFYG